MVGFRFSRVFYVGLLVALLGGALAGAFVVPHRTDDAASPVTVPVGRVGDVVDYAYWTTSPAAEMLWDAAWSGGLLDLSGSGAAVGQGDLKFLGLRRLEVRSALPIEDAAGNAHPALLIVRSGQRSAGAYELAEFVDLDERTTFRSETRAAAGRALLAGSVEGAVATTLFQLRPPALPGLEMQGLRLDIGATLQELSLPDASGSSDASARVRTWVDSRARLDETETVLVRTETRLPLALPLSSMLDLLGLPASSVEEIATVDVVGWTADHFSDSSPYALLRESGVSLDGPGDRFDVVLYRTALRLENVQLGGSPIPWQAHEGPHWAAERTDTERSPEAYPADGAEPAFAFTLAQALAEAPSLYAGSAFESWRASHPDATLAGLDYLEDGDESRWRLTYASPSGAAYTIEIREGDPNAPPPGVFPLLTVRLVQPQVGADAYGTKVAAGDVDAGEHGAPKAVIDPEPDASICRIDFGSLGTITDDTFYLRLGSGPLQVHDLRLTGFGSRPPGSHLTDSDTTERGATPTCGTYAVSFYDVDNSGAYSAGDQVLVGNDQDRDGRVEASTNAGDWWVRLIAYGAHAKGTLVKAGDGDVVVFGAGTPLDGSEFAYLDLNTDGVFSAGDGAYLTSQSVEIGQDGGGTAFDDLGSHQVVPHDRSLLVESPATIAALSQDFASLAARPEGSPNFLRWGLSVASPAEPCLDGWVAPASSTPASFLRLALVGEVSSGSCSAPGGSADANVLISDVGTGMARGAYASEVRYATAPNELPEARAGAVRWSVAPPSIDPGVPLPVPETAAAAAATAATLFVVAYYWPILKVALAKFAWVFGYARITREDATRSPVREGIVALVKSQPGIHASEIARHAEVGWGTVVHHLGVLERSHILSSLVEGRHRRYFAVGAVDHGVRGQLAVLVNPNTRRLHEMLLSTPGLGQQDLAPRLGLGLTATLWHLERLERAGLVTRKKVGRRFQYFARPKAESGGRAEAA